jgi:2-C-methyl-D-erythritol 4-phosphate cytidylyltransferase
MTKTPNRLVWGGCAGDFRISPFMTDLPSPASEGARSKVFVLIASAGIGSRAGGPADLPKQYQLLCGQALILHTLKVFQGLSDLVGAVAIAVAPQDALIDPLLQGRSEVILRCGGATRADTVRQGLQDWQQLAGGPGPDDWVLVHDAARCLIEPALVRRLIGQCRHDAVGGLLALPLPDTLKTERGGRVVQTLDRSGKWLAQTPQMFRCGALLRALQKARSSALPVTDEASAMEAQGLAPLLVPGSLRNFKVTYPEDFSLAQALLQGQSASAKPS